MIIWRLNMSLGRKIALILLMCTSLLTAAASITKAWSCQSVSAELEEPQYASSSLALWAGVEQTLVIILGSISALCSASKLNFPFFNRFRSSIASLLGAVQQKKLSVSRNSYTQPDSYHDLERSSDNLGRLHVDTNGNYTGYFLDTTATRFKGGSRESLVIDKANKKCLAS
jgi:hypothetical protein